MDTRLMKNFILPLMACLAMSSVSSASDEWVPLFNGQNLDGWRQINGFASYRAENGAIIGTTAEGSPNSFLCTEKLYRDFELEFEVLLDPRLNSGVQIRSNSFPDYQNGRVHGYQVEVTANGEAGFVYDEARRGWLSLDRSDPKARGAFLEDEWNHFRVVGIADSIKTWINGVPVADLVDSLTLRGFICLQVHSFEESPPAEVRWRNIRIRELDDYGWSSLFDGQSLDGWYTYLSGVSRSSEPLGKNNDPNGIFQVREGLIHMYADQPANSRGPFGYIASQEEFSNYHLRLQYRWGTKKFAPREERKRDSGLLYHFVGEDRVWPTSVECQIQEGDVGDTFTVYTVIETTVDPTTRESEPKFMEASMGGVPLIRGEPGKIARVIKNEIHEEEGWNTVEVIVRDDSAVHIVNGRVNNRVDQIRYAGSADNDQLSPLNAGKIILQAEGAEIFYKDIEIRQLPVLVSDE